MQSSTTFDLGYQLESPNSQSYTTNESQEVSLFPAGDHKAQINRRAQRHDKHQTEINIKDPQKRCPLGTIQLIAIKLCYWYPGSGVVLDCIDS